MSKKASLGNLRSSVCRSIEKSLFPQLKSLKRLLKNAAVNPDSVTLSNVGSNGHISGSLVMTFEFGSAAAAAAPAAAAQGRRRSRRSRSMSRSSHRVCQQSLSGLQVFPKRFMHAFNLLSCQYGIIGYEML